MQEVTLALNSEVNTSIQVGDMVYYVPISQQGSTSDAFSEGDISNVVQLGEIVSILPSSITVLWDDSDNDNDGFPDISLPTTSDFIMFGKDASVNTSGIKGYYADVEFENNPSNDQSGYSKRAELFSIGSDITASSE